MRYGEIFRIIVTTYRAARFRSGTRICTLCVQFHVRPSRTCRRRTGPQLGRTYFNARFRQQPTNRKKSQLNNQFSFLGSILTHRLARSGSNGAGIGSTGKSFVLIPRCCRDMCECSEFLDFATVPHSTHLYPGHIVCLSSKCVRNVCAER